MPYSRPSPSIGYSDYSISEQSFRFIFRLNPINPVESYLTKEAGYSLEAISEALTHSDTLTTKTYVNTSNVIPMDVGEIGYRNLKK